MSIDPLEATDLPDPGWPPNVADSRQAESVATESDEAEPTHLVEWEATARRLGRSSVLLLGAGVVAWAVTSLVGGHWSPGSLGNWLGLALLAMVAVEIVVAGGSAVRGMLRAGERGERLSSGDVGLFPPVRRGSERDHDDAARRSGDATT